MVSKKTKLARRAAKEAELNPSETVPSASASPTPEPESAPAEEIDPITRAEQIKEQGNAAFRTKKYAEAIDFYTQAIAAATLQSRSPSTKTLLRLARCQAALGLATPALSTLNTIHPQDDAVLQLRKKLNDLEGHLRNFESSRKKKDWGMARLSLEKCEQCIEAEGDEVPTDWRMWRVELELAKAANNALRMTPNSPEVLSLRGLVLFLDGKLTAAATHAGNALRLDPSYEPAQRLRKRIKDVERLKDEGNNAFKLGQHQQAIEKYGEAIDRIGRAEEEGKGGQIRATLLSNRATTLVKLNKHDEALEDIEASLLLSSKSFKVYRTRARIHLHLEAYDKAVADFKSAIQYAQDDVGYSSERDIRELKSDLKKAEAALKRSKTKDYYKILGVQRDCTEIEIKKAYRRESLKHHPDKGGDEEKFKLVVEANSVERYDMGDDEDGMNDGGFGGGMGGMSQADLANLFAQFSGGGFGGARGGGFGHSHGGYSHGFSF
ncbi:TPR-like protein [Hymenopellis radicata]|nr:TPR-like protein [Hymenopellis radicata]